MKATFTIFFTLILLNVGLSQKTTEDEYNWMSKGYKVMISSGLDMKIGYYFDETQEFSESKGNYLFVYKFLRREKDKSLAGVVIVANSTVSGKTYYYGLPIGEWVKEGGEKGIYAEFYIESPYMSRFLGSVNELDGAMTKAFFGTLWNLFAKNSMMFMPKTASSFGK